MSLPSELEFLADVLVEPSDYYRKSDWLLNDFDAPTWVYSFNFKSPNILDWRVQLSDGSILTDNKNTRLLNGLKHWLIINTSPYGGTGFSNNLDVQYADFNKSMHLIDYLLLNDERLNLYEFGLAALSNDDLKAILVKLTHASSAEESLFKWRKKLVEFTQDLLNKTNSADIDKVLYAKNLRSNIYHLGIGIVSPEDEDEAEDLGISADLIPRLRAALKVNGYIRSSGRGRAVPNSLSIAKEVYHRSVRTKHVDKSVVSFLVVNSLEKTTQNREFSAVRVTTGKAGSPSIGNFQSYRRCLYNLGMLHELGLPAPNVDDLIEIKNFSVDIKSKGRFRTLPSSVVFKSFKNSVEFHFEFGREIIDAFLRLAIYSLKTNTPIKDIEKSTFEKAIGPKLKGLGVKYFSISERQSFNGTRLPKIDYFESFRSSHGLLEILRVYFGATMLVVGALTARRIGEIKELKVGAAIDTTDGYIVFNNRKSTKGLMGLRATEARPIEPIAVKMLKELERFHKILNRTGFGPPCDYIFSPPYANGTGRLNLDYFELNKSLDYFCDYFETDLNSEGKRYYIRQHQLRRFFAILFFYSKSFGGLETLQWMLGHSDISHVWNYITESIGGDVLRGAKSQFIAESLHHSGAENFKELSGLIESHYGTSDFSLIDTDELEGYVSELLESGEVEVEPEFFNGPDGEDFKVVIKVREKDGA